MDEEILAGIKREDIKFLESGQISKHVFPIGRRTAHLGKIPHLIVRIFIMAQKEEDQILYLVQKRGMNKSGFPGYFTDSASGHVTYEENMDLKVIKENAYRELEEEFGIPPGLVEELQFFSMQPEHDQFSPEIAYIFIGKVSSEVELNPDPEELEVDESRFYTSSELKHILDGEKSVDHSKKIWQQLLEKGMDQIFSSTSDSSNQSKPEEKIALFLGRFQPLHKGHHHVMQTALETYGHLKIGIGSSQLSHEESDPFSSDERKQFIKSVMEASNVPEEKFSIYEIPDIFNADKWVDHVISIVGNVDIIVSNSDWVRNLFQKKGHDLSDKILKNMETYNGSRIRGLIAEGDERWKDLVPEPVVDLIRHFDGVKRIKKLKNES